MSYATPADVMARIDRAVLVQLTADEAVIAPDAEPDQDRIAHALDDAARTIDGYLARLDAARRPDTDVLRPYAIDIALYRLARARPGQHFESIKAGYDEAVAFLKALAEGRFKYGEATGTDPATLAMTDGPQPVMTRDSLADL